MSFGRRLRDHSPYCKTMPEVAWRHDRELFLDIFYMAVQFIENRPPNAVIIPHGEEKATEIRTCLYCGHPQVQFSKQRRHNKNCIIPQMRGCMRRMREHMEIHEDYRQHLPWPETRSERAAWRHFFKGMDKGGIRVKMNPAKTDQQLAILKVVCQ